MKWFGLTGGIATGKSTVAEMMRARRVRVIDADALAREVVEPGEPALDALVDAFGSEILTSEGRLDRARLGEIVFESDDGAARATLNAIVHPAIAQRSAHYMQRARAEGLPFVVYDAALIVENDLHRAMDGLVVVTVSPETQLQRLVARDGMTREAAQARIDAQISPEERLEHATWVIDNDGTLVETEAQVEDVVREMRRVASDTSEGT